MKYSLHIQTRIGDWPIVKELEELGYDGPLAIELEDHRYSGKTADNSDGIRAAKDYLEGILG